MRSKRDKVDKLLWCLVYVCGFKCRWISFLAAISSYTKWLRLAWVFVTCRRGGVHTTECTTGNGFMIICSEFFLSFYAPFLSVLCLVVSSPSKVETISRLLLLEVRVCVGSYYKGASCYVQLIPLSSRPPSIQSVSQVSRPCRNPSTFLHSIQSLGRSSISCTETATGSSRLRSLLSSSVN